MKKLIASFLALSLLLMLVSCNKTQIQSSSSVSDTSYKVVDSRGTEVAFDKTPEKIITLSPANTEIVYALGLGDKIIAVSKYCNYPEDTKNKQKLDSGSMTNIESLIGLKPDVIIFSKMAQTEAQFKQLEDAGIKVIVTEAIDIEGTYKILEIIGKALNKSTKAEEIINGMKSDFESIKNQVKEKTSQKVYIEISPLEYGLWSGGKGTFQDDLITIVGAENIFSDINSNQVVSEEQVISRAPEIIFTTVGEAEGISDPIGEIKGRQNWDKISAVKNNRIYILPDNELTIPGPRLVQAAKDMIKALYDI